MVITSEKEYKEALAELHSMIECQIDGMYTDDIDALVAVMSEWERKMEVTHA